MGTKYAIDVLKRLVASSSSVSDVIRKTGGDPHTGSHGHVSKLIRKHGIDISHFAGQAWNAGDGHVGGLPKKAAKQILVLLHKGQPRAKTYQLRRAMVEFGIAYKCAMCHSDPVWKGKPLVLEIDHENGNNRDNRPGNVRFLCPNCHSQTEGFCGRRMLCKLSRQS